MEEINLDNNTTLCQKRMYYNSDGPCLLVRVGLRVTLGEKKPPVRLDKSRDKSHAESSNVEWQMPHGNRSS